MVIGVEHGLNGVDLERTQFIPVLIPNRFLNLWVEFRERFTHRARALHLECREIVIRIVRCWSSAIGELLLGRHRRFRFLKHVCA